MGEGEEKPTCQQSVKFDQYGLPYLDFGTGVVLKMEMVEPTGEVAEKATRELRETPENVEKGVKELQELILADKELFCPIEKEYLITYLRPCKFYADSAYEKIRRYFQFKHKHPDFCSDLHPRALRHVFEDRLVHVQPNRDKHGRRIVVMEMGRRWDPSRVPLVDVFRALQMAMQGGVTEPITQVHGIVSIMDFEGLSWYHMAHFPPSLMIAMFEWILRCAPVRLKGIHVIHQPRVFSTLRYAAKPFSTKKFSSRMHYHGDNLKGLWEHVGRENLIPRFGGTLQAEEMDPKLGLQILEMYQEEHEFFEQFGYDKNFKGPVTDGMFKMATEKIIRFQEIYEREQKQLREKLQEVQTGIEAL